jgi:hypothetical protein
MNYLKFTPYIYLAAAVFFGYLGVTKISDPEGGYQLDLFIAAICIFMFFFRRRFAKKFEERNRKP